ncbi:MAG: putative zinc-binding metallopeptidase [Planctomycetes bacterium]|nr:putative zinc-binding metallopeptidase [Planctomycetota bacterium]
MTLPKPLSFAIGAAFASIAAYFVVDARRTREPDWSRGIETLDAVTRATLDELGRRHGLSFDVRAAPSGAGGNVHHGVVRPEELARFVRWLDEEWSRYPTCWFEATRLARVIFCRELVLEHERVGGFVDGERHDLYLETSVADEAHARRAVHHEFAHAFDDATSHDGEDVLWTALNPPNFAYGAGGLSRVSDPAASRLESASVGFVTGYATASPQEDKAELFAWLMTAPEEVRRLAAGDPYLAAKWDELCARFGAPCGATTAALPLAKR